MREIKFRAWCSVKNLMLYNPLTGRPEPINDSFHNSSYRWMQYTGLKDRNGRDVYEGDICNVLRHDRKTWEVCEIIWTETECAFSFRGYWSGKNTGGYYGVRITQVLEFEIIGNIYENPELLESPGV